MLSHYPLQIFPEEQYENYLYDSILKESYYDEKIKLGEQLGKIKSKTSKTLLTLLLDNPYHWNREAAIAGILTEHKPDWNEIVIKFYLKDPFLKSRIRRGIIKDIQLYFNDLIKFYESEPNPIHKNQLHKLIVISPNSEDYFREQFEATKETRELEK